MFGKRLKIGYDFFFLTSYQIICSHVTCTIYFSVISIIEEALLNKPSINQSLNEVWQTFEILDFQVGENLDCGVLGYGSVLSGCQHF
jgi:hypothetical protein